MSQNTFIEETFHSALSILSRSFNIWYSKLIKKIQEQDETLIKRADLQGHLRIIIGQTTLGSRKHNTYEPGWNNKERRVIDGRMKHYL